MTPHLSLPDRVRACLFDLDGVLTDTASVHAAAWKAMFDEYLAQHASGDAARPFDIATDYRQYVDGKSRADGTRAFLASRGITLPEGGADDPPDADTVHGLGNRKNEMLLEKLRNDGVRVFAGSVRFVRAVREAGLRTAVVSASANTPEVLRAAGITDLFDTRVDGVVAASRHLAGKPAPDTYLAAAELLGVEPAAAGVFEDALAGVEAGRAGGFGYVVGVDRVGQAEGLRAAGADTVVTDLSELLGEP
ncbi:MAG TPA: beta-phosphoglucomutase family hydrolase [Acidimicrobiia bacterium]|nr:beta-phosphoglucomutase family hydrolase [Acidimicrobiia bacterium]